MQTSLFGKHLSIEYRNGTGIDIEFCDSRPVWVHNTDTEETEAMPFMGTAGIYWGLCCSFTGCFCLYGGRC